MLSDGCAGLIVAASAGASLVPRLGVRPVLAAGVGSSAAGLALLAALAMTVHRNTFILTLVPGLDGVASRLYNTALQVGRAIGIAALAAVSTSQVEHSQLAGQTATEAVTGGRALALPVASALRAAGVGLAWRLPSDTGRTPAVRRPR